MKPGGGGGPPPPPVGLVGLCPALVPYLEDRQGQRAGGKWRHHWRFTKLLVGRVRRILFLVFAGEWSFSPKWSTNLWSKCDDAGFLGDKNGPGPGWEHFPVGRDPVPVNLPSWDVSQPFRTPKTLLHSQGQSAVLRTPPLSYLARKSESRPSSNLAPFPPRQGWGGHAI